jgi:SAM-dependent methyltransferase
VLDLGCGSGWLSIFLARAGFAVTGVDISDHALELARTWAAQENLAINFDQGDIAVLDYPMASFDAIVANSIFEHLTYELAQSTLETAHKILAPNGCLIACFDYVGTGPGDYFELEDGTHVYTDKGRKGMMLRCFSDDEIRRLLQAWEMAAFDLVESKSRFVVAVK